MVIIIKNFLRIYINNLTIDDVTKYISNNYNNVTKDEINIIFYYIKNKWELILDNNPIIWNELKNKLSSYTYQEIIKLYNKYSYLK